MFVGTICIIIGFSLFIRGCAEASIIITIIGVILLALGNIFYLRAKNELETKIEKLEKELKEMKQNDQRNSL